MSASWTFAPAREESRSLSRPPHRTQPSLLATANRARLSKLGPRAARAVASVEMRLLNPPQELDELADWREAADLVLVDAPCSGSGTWRRNPEGRWRLTPERLDRVVALQQRLLDIAAELVKPGGRLVYAVCSLLSREGAGQIDCFLQDRSSWISEETPISAGVRTVRAGSSLRATIVPTDFSSRGCVAHVKRRRYVESLMRSLPRLLLVGFAALTLAAPVASQRPDDQILPKSVELRAPGAAADVSRKARAGRGHAGDVRSRSIRATAAPSSIWPALPKNSICSARRSA